MQTKAGAQEYERQLRSAMLTPEADSNSEKEVKTFRRFVKEFLQYYVKVENKPSEQRTKKIVFDNHLIPAFGRKRLDEITVRDIDRFKSQKLSQGRSPKTVNNYLAILSRCLVIAVEWEELEKTPKIKMLKTPEPEFDYLDFDEARRLLEAAKSEPHWWTMILVALRTGLRQGELLALRWQDVDLVAKRLSVRQAAAGGIIGTPKSGRRREIELGEEVLTALKDHRHLRGELVFCHETGRLLRANECKHPLWRACKRAGLRRIGWHVLRHTFASHLVMRGAPLKAVQELLGHADIRMTMRYAHLNEKSRREAVKLLDFGHYLGNEKGGVAQVIEYKGEN